MQFSAHMLFSTPTTRFWSQILNDWYYYNTKGTLLADIPLFLLANCVVLPF